MDIYDIHMNIFDIQMACAHKGWIGPKRPVFFFLINVCHIKYCRGTRQCGAMGLSGSGLTKSLTLALSMLDMLPSNARDFDHGAVPAIGAIAAMPNPVGLIQFPKSNELRTFQNCGNQLQNKHILWPKDHC